MCQVYNTREKMSIAIFPEGAPSLRQGTLIEPVDESAQQVAVTSVRHKRKSPEGIATTDLVLSASVGTNAEIFPQVLELHVPDGATIADVTYSVGAFWRNVPPDQYHVLATDIKTGVDCRALPYADASLDCVVLDPRIWRACTAQKQAIWPGLARMRLSAPPIPPGKP